MSAVLLVLPTVTTETCTAGVGGAESCRSRSISLLESEGASILPVVLVPVLLPALALMWRSSRALLISLGVTYLVLAGLAVLSVGVFYLPAAIALLLAGIASRRTTATPQAD